MSVTSKMESRTSTLGKHLQKSPRRTGAAMAGSQLGSPSESFAAYAQAISRFKKLSLSKLEWLIDFARTPSLSIETLTEMSLTKLHAEVRAFSLSVSDPESVKVVTHHRGGSEVRKQISTLARVAERAIAGVLSEDGYSFSPSEFGRTVRHVRQIPGDGGPALIIASDHGDLSAHFVEATDEIIESDGDRISKCISKDCERLFVKRKRGLYCSLRCSRRERQRLYRKNLTAQDRYDLRRAQYIKAVDKIDQNKVVRSRGPRREA
jgi:hypothetical protein